MGTLLSVWRPVRWPITVGVVVYPSAMALRSAVGGATGFKAVILLFLLLVGLSMCALARMLGISAAGTSSIGFRERTRYRTISAVRGRMPLPFFALGSIGPPTFLDAGHRRRWATNARRDYRLLTGALARHGELIGLAVVTLVGGAIRLIRLDYLSLRIDEGYTLLYSRQSWPDVLGLHGFYAPHPPLFFALAKLANVFVPEQIAARSVAAVAGTATIVVLYAIVARLIDRRAAVAAAAVLAVSPFHIEASRDGRMYAPVVFVVALTYLALIAYWQRPAPLWAVVYGAAATVAVYLDYSAAYALAPQVVLLGIIVWRYRRRALWLVCATVGAVALYLPWLPQIAHTVHTLDGSGDQTGRVDYLAATWPQIRATIPVVAGFNGRGSSSGGYLNAWDRWSGDRTYFLVVLAAIVCLGLWAMRYRLHAGLVALLLLFGTPFAAIVVSQVSPGYAPRTLVPAALGLALLAGAPLAKSANSARPPRWIGVAGAAGLVFLVMMSAVTIPATMSSSGRYDWREIDDVLAGQAHLGKPIVVHSSAGMLTDIVDLYAEGRLHGMRILTITHGTREGWTGGERFVARGPSVAAVKHGALQEFLPPGDPGSDAFWYVTRLGGKTVVGAFAKLGYQEILALPFRGANVSLYARPGAVLGVPIAQGNDFSPADTTTEWQYPGTFNLTSPGLYSLSATLVIDGEATADLRLSCDSTDGAELAAYERDFAATELPAGGNVGIALLCPEGSSKITVALRRTGQGTATFSNMVLSGSTTTTESASESGFHAPA